VNGPDSTFHFVNMPIGEQIQKEYQGVQIEKSKYQAKSHFIGVFA
jgi:hypothetical protein